VTGVVIVGLATEYCVKETSLDAVRLGFGATVLRNGIRAIERDVGDGEQALGEMGRRGVVIE
jgi:nicotinamidase/pyrazinamidase